MPERGAVPSREEGARVNVQVWSHFRDESWEGEVPDELLPADAVNEALFRLLNRVDEGDVARLEAWGYRLPSLSVGDTVTWEGRVFRVAAIGFDEIRFDGGRSHGVVA